jgi:hypothetical protein
VVENESTKLALCCLVLLYIVLLACCLGVVPVSFFRCPVCGNRYLKRFMLRGTQWFLHDLSEGKRKRIGRGCYIQTSPVKIAKEINGDKRPKKAR